MSISAEIQDINVQQFQLEAARMDILIRKTKLEIDELQLNLQGFDLSKRMALLNAQRENGI